MKNGVYVTIQDIHDEQTLRSNSGVIKKILSQYDIFKKYYNMRLDIFPKDLKKGFAYKILVRTPFYPIHCHWKIAKDYSHIDFLYIRMETIDGFFVSYLKKIRAQNKKIIIVAEIPTYPYDMEFHTLRSLHVLVKNRFNRNKLHKYIDKIATFSLDDAIFGIETIKIINGINTGSVPVISQTKNDASIHLIAVANMLFWHGLDRLIFGMADYYQNNGDRDIKLDIVGYGEEYDNLNSMIENNNLRHCIRLLGFQNGDDLDAVFYNTDIAISSLGDHRKGLRLISALKTREYLARGLPIVASTRIDILPENYKYCLYIPQNDSHVDIKNIITFYDSLYSQNSRKSVIHEIRNFAETHCDIKNTFQPVLDYIAMKINAEN
jgi:glycosyltransferase involved in cell wall biosynthesis